MRPLPWVRASAHSPYFELECGTAWHPVGHNDAITWDCLSDAVSTAERTRQYFATLRRSGVTVLRVMLEYAQRNGRYLERPAGRFTARAIRTWDRLFALAEEYGVRFLLTPFDTFWMWKRWAHHPYNCANGGPCTNRRTMLTSPEVRAAIKARFAFAIDRWGASGALFAWDLWNEIHPAYAEDDPGAFDDFVSDMASFVRAREHDRFGRAHPLTVSAFSPLLSNGFHSKELGATEPDPRVNAVVFRHPLLDFATLHTYAHGTIDDPRDTVAPALAMAGITADAVAETGERRPYLDSEHGPIHTFKDKRRVLPEPFDNEYFRHVQWAHLASGGAGGGMRWPNRRPHCLTAGMHDAQAALARFLPLLEWSRFARRNLTATLQVSAADVAAIGCGDTQQAIVWMVRRSGFARNGTLARGRARRSLTVDVPGLAPGQYRVTTWNTERGAPEQEFAVVNAGVLRLETALDGDMAMAIRAVA
jgi:hypothetical protein